MLLEVNNTHQAVADFRAEHIASAEYVEDEFARANGSYSDVAYHMSHALHALHYHATKEHERIPKAQAAKIERAIDAASSGVSDMFGARPDWAFAMHSLTSAKDLARHWAERAPAYGGLGARTIRLPSCHVLWLRNCCYNAALLEEIDEHFIRQASDARRALRSSRLSRCSYLE